jgi:hypothetical protein
MPPRSLQQQQQQQAARTDQFGRMGFQQDNFSPNQQSPQVIQILFL